MRKLLSLFCILYVISIAASKVASCHANPPTESEANPPTWEPSPAPTPDCASLIYEMVDCLPFLTNDESKPDDSCCSGFETVLATDADCICEVMNEGDNLGFTLDLTRAMMLPTACGVPSPFTECNTSVAPALSPHSAPLSAPESPGPSPDSEDHADSPSEGPTASSSAHKAARPGESPAPYPHPIQATAPTPRSYAAQSAAVSFGVLVISLMIGFYYQNA